MEVLFGTARSIPSLFPSTTITFYVAPQDPLLAIRIWSFIIEDRISCSSQGATEFAALLGIEARGLCPEILPTVTARHGYSILARVPFTEPKSFLWSSLNQKSFHSLFFVID